MLPPKIRLKKSKATKVSSNFLPQDFTTIPNDRNSLLSKENPIRKRERSRKTISIMKIRRINMRRSSQNFTSKMSKAKSKKLEAT